ncbi:DUF3040 domain-containing protein [Nocardioides sp. LHD-245]|uniref:DUF3040 domain-containing protein n=1 Tax=Nocardioides sp. LHD-245 TaxID=3051387 RepID=UPI0027E06AC1|nr:DUF3040 domain-containing protein [Nocardioides sp. LHD-245]
MPLSEEELRLLEQMERALSEEDPKFASTLRGTTLRQAARRRAILAGVVFTAGVAVMMGGAVSGYWPVGVAGFLIMLASATILMGSLRGQRPGAGPHVSSHPSGLGVVDGGRRGRSHGHGRSSGFMDTLQARWRRRRDRGF